MCSQLDLVFTFILLTTAQTMSSAATVTWMTFLSGKVTCTEISFTEIIKCV